MLDLVQRLSNMALAERVIAESLARCGKDGALHTVKSEAYQEAADMLMAELARPAEDAR